MPGTARERRKGLARSAVAVQPLTNRHFRILSVAAKRQQRLSPAAHRFALQAAEQLAPKENVVDKSPWV